jgi:hypothetical protein
VESVFIVGNAMQTSNRSRNGIWTLNRYTYGVLIGAVIGLAGGLLALLLTVGDPVIAFGAVFGVMAGLYVLSNVSAALYGVILVTALLPFGTLPFKVGVTPTFLDMALGAFILVYAMQWMTGRRQGFRLTPVHALVALYVMWLLLAFALGLRYAPPTTAIIRQFAETLLSIAIVFILGDLIRDPRTLKRLVIAVMFAIGVQAVIAIILYILPDQTAEELLVRLARFGYPNGGVIRFIEDNPAGTERAIGTWVDPNALGGVLAISAAMIASSNANRWSGWRRRGAGGPAACGRRSCVVTGPVRRGGVRGALRVVWFEVLGVASGAEAAGQVP